VSGLKFSFEEQEDKISISALKIFFFLKYNKNFNRITSDPL